MGHLEVSGSNQQVEQEQGCIAASGAGQAASTLEGALACRKNVLSLPNCFSNNFSSDKEGIAAQLMPLHTSCPSSSHFELIS